MQNHYFTVSTILWQVDSEISDKIRYFSVSAILWQVASEISDKIFVLVTHKISSAPAFDTPMLPMLLRWYIDLKDKSYGTTSIPAYIYFHKYYW